MSPRKMFRLRALSALAVLSTACSGVGLRPDGTPKPQDCPREAMDAMIRMGITPDDTFSVVVDARQESPQPTRLEEGPIESYMDEAYRRLPLNTRLFGRVWTAGEMVVIRYYEAQIPGRERIPFCAEMDDSGGQEKYPESPPGVAIIQDNFAVVRAVSRYGEIDLSKERGRVYIFRDTDELPPPGVRGMKKR